MPSSNRPVLRRPKLRRGTVASTTVESTSDAYASETLYVLPAGQSAGRSTARNIEDATVAFAAAVSDRINAETALVRVGSKSAGSDARYEHTRTIGSAGVRFIEP